MLANRKIVIIGTGHVGSHCAYALAIQGICDEIVLVDKDRTKAKSHSMDIADSVSFFNSSVIVRCGDYSDCKDADIVSNLNKIEIKGIIITITNPADIIADFVRKATGLPKNRVFSTGTSLDTARMRRTVADLCNIAPQSVIGFAMGEHGDSSMVPFSNLTIFGKNYKHLKEENPERFGKLSEKVITDQTHMRGMDIIEGKGSTEFGIGTALADMAKAVLMDEHRILPASTLLEGEYGQTNVHAGVPCIIGRNGIEQIIELKLTDEELKQFENSCNVIKQHMVE